jgi:hypothetical protein
MGTAIALRGTRNAILRNVWISGFDKGIEASDSSLLLSGVNIRGCGTGLDLRSSVASVSDSKFLSNAIDIAVDKSTASMIDIIARRILEITPKGDYRINYYKNAHIVRAIIDTREVKKKRLHLRKLLDALKYPGYLWTAYQIIKEVSRALGKQW